LLLYQETVIKLNYVPIHRLLSLLTRIYIYQETVN